MPMSSNSRRRKANALIVLAMIHIRLRETSSMYAKASTPLLNSFMKHFSPGRKVRQDNAGPMGSPRWTPLEKGIVLVSPESIRKNTFAGLVP